MRSMRWIPERLQEDFPQFTFKAADEFWWSAATNTIYINSKAQQNREFTLHELSHALLGHQGYKRDVELLKLERDAWEHAKTVLAARYDISIDEDIVQDNLDTYRRWLHARSACPECETVGIQTKEQLYKCVACGLEWRVNEARLCALRRYSLKATK